MPENQAVLFGGLNLGVLRILLFQGLAESPMERLAPLGFQPALVK